MTINKFQGKTKEEAIEKARSEFGSGAVIMNVKEVKPKGLFRAFKSSTYEVTAAMEERESFASQLHNMPQNTEKGHGAINLAADEKIEIPRQEKKPAPAPLVPAGTKRNHVPAEESESKLEQRLEDLSDRLEKTLGAAPREDRKENRKENRKEKVLQEPSSEELNFVRILYNTLVKNEVNEKYVNQILDEIEKFMRPGSSVDTILSNVYQKLILRFGQPRTIDLSGEKPNVVFFIGPTGVGKTTTIAKIASKYKVEYERKVAFITADTYRIAATEQLAVYANILDAPMEIVYSPEDLNAAIAKFEDYDLVFVDTAGFSHKNESQRGDIKNLLEGVDSKYRRETYLVLSATTKYRDLLEIVDIYHEIADYKLIFTKLDETTAYGNLLNVKLYSGADLSYATNGQNVPDDIEVFDTQKIVKQLLGGNS
ncbi:MAG: flagellar biosynthesis protein FlhF [Lachnospiraceae bacterium]|nr:flagellar biosynthesis protein FlhF [Lachnospiraceae bacterium]